MGNDENTKAQAAAAEKELAILEAILKRRGFFWQAEEVYGGMRGFYDYGVLGAKLKARVLAIWRRLYVTISDCLEIDGCSMSSSKVFSASGHLEKFVDVVVNCLKCGASFRADHLLEEHMENADGLPLETMDEKLAEFGVTCLQCKGELSKARTQNLMFETTVGREQTAYLRPETAQSIFLNFPNLYRYAREKLPFGVAQIGKGFRNEISPRQGLIRLREFNMAEVEFFYDRDNSAYMGGLRKNILAGNYSFLQRTGRGSQEQILEKFGAVNFDAGQRYAKEGSDQTGANDPGVAPLFHSLDLSGILSEQLNFVAANGGDPKKLELSFAETLESGLICSPLLCHHLIVAYSFMRMLGFDPASLRFRQHLPQEMAHYAADCWDLEVAHRNASGGVDWIETIGIADRSAYDLSSHMEASGRDFRVFEKFDEPRLVTVLQVKPDMKALGREFRKDARIVAAALQGADQDILKQVLVLRERSGTGEGFVHINPETEELCLEESKGCLTVPFTSFTLEEGEEKITGRKFIPSVVEPSFGVDRVIYGLLNSSFRHEKKDGEDYSYFSLSPSVAPITAGIFPLTKDERLVKIARDIVEELKSLGLDTVYDASGSVGRRYARMDEIGTPFCVTVDFDSLEDGAVTIRFTSTRQIRVPYKKLKGLMEELTRVF